MSNTIKIKQGARAFDVRSKSIVRSINDGSLYGHLWADEKTGIINQVPTDSLGFEILQSGLSFYKGSQRIFPLDEGYKQGYLDKNLDPLSSEDVWKNLVSQDLVLLKDKTHRVDGKITLITIILFLMNSILLIERYWK